MASSNRQSVLLLYARNKHLIGQERLTAANIFGSHTVFLYCLTTSVRSSLPHFGPRHGQLQQHYVLPLAIHPLYTRLHKFRKSSFLPGAPLPVTQKLGADYDSFDMDNKLNKLNW